MNAEEFVKAARSLKGAKWRHRGRSPWAVDCIGLVAVAASRAGMQVRDVKGYGREPWDDLLRRGCRERFDGPFPIAEAKPGDVAIFRWAQGEPSHIGILGNHPDGGLSLIHSHVIHGVVECSLSGRYASCLVEVFRPRFA